MIKECNSELTHADVFPVWYIDKKPSRPVSYSANGGTFYITDSEDCGVNLSKSAPYVIPLESNKHGWWGPKVLLVSPDGNFYNSLNVLNDNVT